MNKKAAAYAAEQEAKGFKDVKIIGLLYKSIHSLKKAFYPVTVKAYSILMKR